MSTAAGPGSRADQSASATLRRAPVPGRRQLLGASAMVAVGSFLPWLDTPVGTVLGGRGPGLWTCYAAVLGLAGVMVPIRRLAIIQGALLALVALALPAWQVIHVLDLVGLQGWLPGPGLVLVVGGGVLAAAAVRRMATAPA